MFAEVCYANELKA